jgi:hypothetical protein
MLKNNTTFVKKQHSTQRNSVRRHCPCCLALPRRPPKRRPWSSRRRSSNVLKAGRRRAGRRRAREAVAVVRRCERRWRWCEGALLPLEREDEAHLCQVPGGAKPLPRRGAQPRVTQENVLGPLLPRSCPPEALIANLRCEAGQTASGCSSGNKGRKSGRVQRSANILENRVSRPMPPLYQWKVGTEVAWVPQGLVETLRKHPELMDVPPGQRRQPQHDGSWASWAATHGGCSPRCL